MAVVGEVASIVGLCGAAFELGKVVYNIVDSFKSQRQKILDIRKELGTLTVVLDAINQKLQNSTNVQRFEILREPILCCIEICTEMRDMLARCNTHIKDTGTSVRDWLQMRYRGGSFDDMKQRLAAYKSTLSITFDMINIQEQGATQESLNALKSSIEGTKDDLSDQISNIRDSIDDASASLRTQLQADQTRLQKCFDRLTQAQSTTNTIRPQITTDRNKAGINARAIFGTDSTNPTFNLSASDNEAQTGATVGCGVLSPETLQMLLRGTTAADIMAVLQTPQTHPSNITTELLRSTLASRVEAQAQPTTSGEPSRIRGQNLIEGGVEQTMQDVLGDQATESRVQERA